MTELKTLKSNLATAIKLHREAGKLLAAMAIELSGPALTKALATPDQTTEQDTTKADILRLLNKYNETGMTRREMTCFSRSFKKLPDYQCSICLDELLDSGQIESRVSKSVSGRGSKRHAYFLTSSSKKGVEKA